MSEALYPTTKRTQAEWQYPADVPMRLLPAIFAQDLPMINGAPIRGYVAKMTAYDRPCFREWFDERRKRPDIRAYPLSTDEMFATTARLLRAWSDVVEGLGDMRPDMRQRAAWAIWMAERADEGQLGSDPLDRVRPEHRATRKDYVSGAMARTEWARIELILQDVRLAQARQDPVWLAIPYPWIQCAEHLASFLLTYAEEAISQPMFFKQVQDLQERSDPKGILRVLWALDDMIDHITELWNALGAAEQGGADAKTVEDARAIFRSEPFESVYDLYRLSLWIRDHGAIDALPETWMSEGLREVIRREDPQRLDVLGTFQRYFINKGEVQTSKTSREDNIRINTSGQDASLTSAQDRVAWALSRAMKDVGSMLRRPVLRTPPFADATAALTRVKEAGDLILKHTTRQHIDASQLLDRSVWDIRKWGFVDPPVPHPLYQGVFQIEYYIDDPSDPPKFFKGQLGGWVQMDPTSGGSIDGSPWLSQQGSCCVLGTAVAHAGAPVSGEVVLGP